MISDSASVASADTFDNTFLQAICPPNIAQQLHNKVFALLDEVFDKYGNITSYLEETIGADDAKATQFILFLDELCSEGAAYYNASKVLPAQNLRSDEVITDDLPRVKLHAACLGFSVKSSIKGAPNNVKVKEMISFYLLDGFVTSLEPLVVTQPADLLVQAGLRKLPTPWKGMDAFSVGYSKGYSRAVSLLGLLLICFEGQIDIAEEWNAHARYGGEFQDLVEKIIEEFGTLIPEKDRSKGKDKDGKEKGNTDEKEKDKGKCNKRAGCTIELLNPVIKKVKVADAFMKTIEAVGENNKLMEFDLCNKGGGISVHVKFQNKVFFFNRSQTTGTLQPGHVIAGFGGGKYKQLKQGEEANAEKEVLFEVKPSTMVLNGTQLTTVEQMVKQKRCEDPEAKVAYHEIKEDPSPEDASKFTLTLVSKVAFIPNAAQGAPSEGEDGKPKSLQARAASLLPASSWESHCTSVLWTVRWSAIGLTPVKPQVVLTKELALEPAYSCEL
eukprot:Skav236403  [mRNA]  locus=scaffold1702:119198:123414:- [translate_table: standard]